MMRPNTHATNLLTNLNESANNLMEKDMIFKTFFSFLSIRNYPTTSLVQTGL